MKRETKKAKKAARKQVPEADAPTTGKQARSASASLSPAKAPTSLGIDHTEAWHRRPVWRFGDLDTEAPPAIGSLSVNDFRELHEKLGKYETQTCAEIWGQHDNGCKKYEVDGAHDNISARLTELERDDETAVHTLRVNGKYRIYGILRQHIFYVLWIDRQHEMWPSAKKHT